MSVDKRRQSLDLKRQDSKHLTAFVGAVITYE
jgi:hypothetical protein